MQQPSQQISACPNCGGVLEETSTGELGCMSCLLRAAIGGQGEVAHDPTQNASEDGDRFGVYEIDRREDGSFHELGHGAMGVTYRAIDTTLQRKVALKVIRIGVATRSTEARERFLREARAAAALRHEHIATVFQFGICEETGQFFYAMELVEGETLEEWVQRTGPLSARATIEIAQQVTSALTAAEKRTLVHRDLKPSNLMLVSPEDEERGAATVKIIDFGLAKLLNAPVDAMRLTHDGFVGTPAFASPEQFENSALDVRSDIYSLGATLWFALTGKTPFDGHGLEEIRRAQQSDVLPIEQLKAARVPSRLRSLLKSMLAFEPAARPGTHELAAELRRCAAEADGERRARLALAATAILLLGVSAFAIFWPLSTGHRPAPVTKKPPVNLPAPEKSIAFDLYTRARNLFLTPSFNVGSKSSLLEAVDLLNQSVARDSSFIRAYCLLAFAHDALYFFGHDHTPARLAQAEGAIQAASRLGPDAGETHLARAWNLYWGYFDYEGALAEVEVARRTLPNDPQILFVTGLIQRRQGHWEESTRSLERAAVAERDPRNFGVLQSIAENYKTLGRYAEQKRWLGRVLAVEPNDAATKLILASVDFEQRADTQPLHQTIDSVRATSPAAAPNIDDWWLRCALAERDAAAAKDALIAAGENPIGLGDDVLCNRPFMEGVIARVGKDDDRARSDFTAARAEQEKIVQTKPNFAPPWCVLGLIDAALGRKEDALREGRRAVELLPVEKDSVTGPAMIKYLAMIAAWVGDSDLACQQLAVAVRPPRTVTYGQLKLLPFWDPLRGDACFEKIVASLAPQGK